MFLGVDGGGTKTAYVLVDPAGHIRARHAGPSVSHLAVGFERAQALLIAGIDAVLAAARATPDSLTFSFLGLPAYGEDSATTEHMDALPSARLDRERYRCGNDMICSWAGSLGCNDGISVIAGTGSMAYGVYDGRTARCGGWGETIGDEGSAYWIAREGMNLFSRMSDGRSERGPLYERVRSKFGIGVDLDLCALLNRVDASTRSTFAKFAPLVHEAAQAGDSQAHAIFTRAADELVQCVAATRRTLAVPHEVLLPVSHSGGVMDGATLLSDAFRCALAAGGRRFEYRSPRYSPDVGAALYAARVAGTPLTDSALQRLSSRA